MNKSRFTIDHVRFESDKSFEEVAKAFERQLGKFDPDVRKAATEGANTEAAKTKIAAMAGSSGLMLFGTQDHGALLRRRIRIKGSPKLLVAFGRCFPS